MVDIQHVSLFLFVLLATAAALERLNEYMIQPIAKKIKKDKSTQMLIMRSATLVLSLVLAFFLHDRAILPPVIKDVPMILFVFIIGLALPFGTEGVHQLLRLVEEAKNHQEVSTAVKKNGSSKEEEVG